MKPLALSLAIALFLSSAPSPAETLETASSLPSLGTEEVRAEEQEQGDRSIAVGIAFAIIGAAVAYYIIKERGGRYESVPDSN